MDIHERVGETELLSDLPTEQINDREPVSTSTYPEEVVRLYVAHPTEGETANIYALTRERDGEPETICRYGAIRYQPEAPSREAVEEALADAPGDWGSDAVDEVIETAKKQSKDTFITEVEKFHFEDRGGAVAGSTLHVEHKDGFTFFLDDDLPKDEIADAYADWYQYRIRNVATDDWHYDLGYCGEMEFHDFRKRAAFLAETTVLTEQEALAQALGECGLTVMEISNVLDKDKSTVWRQLRNVHGDDEDGKRDRAYATVRHVDPVPALSSGSRGTFENVDAP